MTYDIHDVRRDTLHPHWIGGGFRDVRGTTVLLITVLLFYCTTVIHYLSCIMYDIVFQIPVSSTEYWILWLKYQVLPL